jgi:hypothetical protein
MRASDDMRMTRRARTARGARTPSRAQPNDPAGWEIRTSRWRGKHRHVETSARVRRCRPDETGVEPSVKEFYDGTDL